MLTLPKVLRRAGWGVVDQVVSSGTNAALSILVARSVDTSGFGAFSVAFIVFTLFVGLSRALNTAPLAIRFASATEPEFKRAAAAASGAALCLGLVGALVCLVAGLLTGGAAGAALVALSLPLPALLVQDAWRYTFFASARPARAALNDVVWAVGQLATVWVLLMQGVSAVGPFILAWGGAAAVAALVGIYQAGVVPSPRAALGWLRDHFTLTRYLVAEYGTLQAFSQSTMLVISAVASVAVVGSLRGAQVLLGPAALLAISLNTFALPEFSRRRAATSPKQWMRRALLLSAVVTTLGGLWGLAFLLLPDSAGRALLGDTWTGARSVLVAAIVGQAANAVTLGPGVALYAMERASVTVRINTVQAPLVVLFGVGGVLLAGAQGAAWGMAAAFWVLVPVWWLAMRRESRLDAGRLREAAPAPVTDVQTTPPA